MICAREITGALTQARIQLMGAFGFLQAQQQYSAANDKEGKLVADLKNLELTVRSLGVEVAQVRDKFGDLAHSGPTGATG